MTGYVCGQYLLNFTECTDLLKVTVHHLITRNRKQCPFLGSLRIILIFSKDFLGDIQQRYILDDFCFLTRFANPRIAIIVSDNMFTAQI